MGNESEDKINNIKPSTEVLQEFQILSIMFREIHMNFEIVGKGNFTEELEKVNLELEPHEQMGIPDYSECSIELIEDLDTFAKKLLKCNHQLTIEAHSVVHIMLDNMFGIFHKYTHSNQILIPEYRIALGFSQGPQKKNMNWVYNTNPDHIGKNWKRNYNNFYPSLCIIIGQMRTWIERAILRGEFSEEIIDEEYWFIDKCISHMVMNCKHYENSFGTDRELRNIRRRIENNSKGTRIKDPDTSKYKYEKEWIIHLALDWDKQPQKTTLPPDNFDIE